MAKQTKDFFTFKQFTIDQRHAAQKVGTDSDLLGALAAGGDRILDIGTGTGVLSLMMAQRFPSSTITAVEIDENAIIDAKENFSNSSFKERIELVHTPFQEFAKNHEGNEYEAIICNPPYFDKSLEAPDKSRTRARHTSSLPFKDLIAGAYKLLKGEGTFSVCLPPEVLSDFNSECLIEGFWLMDDYQIKSVPEKPSKRHILIYRKGRVAEQKNHISCMRNADRTYSDWYHTLMQDFLL